VRHSGCFFATTADVRCSRKAVIPAQTSPFELSVDHPGQLLLPADAKFKQYRNMNLLEAAQNKSSISWGEDRGFDAHFTKSSSDWQRPLHAR
jgi:hypothetical protein